MLVCGNEGTEGYINLGMPLCCFPQSSHVIITFPKTEREKKENNELCGRFDQPSAECVVFYIHAVGNTEQRILRCRELHKEGTKLCVCLWLQGRDHQDHSEEGRQVLRLCRE